MKSESRKQKAEMILGLISAFCFLLFAFCFLPFMAHE